MDREELICDIVAEEEYIPHYATSMDACMDVKVKLDEPCMIQPNEMAVIGTGIQVKIPEGYGLFVFPRSSFGIKLRCKLANTVGIIDAGYRDEIKLAIVNEDDTPITLVDQQRVCQCLVLPRPLIKWNVVSDDDNFRHNDRGGGIGSTN